MEMDGITDKSSRRSGSGEGQWSPATELPKYYWGGGEGESSTHRERIGRRVLDSFKRDPNFVMTPKGSYGSDGKVFDVESAAQNTANSPLARKLKGRHLQMIAIGGSIGMFLLLFLFFKYHLDHFYLFVYTCWSRTNPCQGTGLFVGSGTALAQGGPVRTSP